MSGIRAIVRSAVVAGVIWSGASCAKNPPPQAGDEQPAALPTDPQDRAAALADAYQQLQGTVAQLPTGNDARDTQTIGEALTRLSSVLQLMEDPEPTGAFRQQVAIIERNAGLISNGQTDRDPEPPINTALNAAYSALRGVARKFEAPKVDEALDGLSDQVRNLDAIRGPLHRFAAADVLRGTTAVAGQMVALVQQSARNLAPAPSPEPAAPQAAPAPDSAPAPAPTPQGEPAVPAAPNE